MLYGKSAQYYIVLEENGSISDENLPFFHIILVPLVHNFEWESSWSRRFSSMFLKE